jgi:C4-dicarboxylate-specific signal transduction histidine kinase
MNSAETMAGAAKRIGTIIKWARTSLKSTKNARHDTFQMREILDRLKEECSGKAHAMQVPVIITPNSDVKVVGDKQQILQVLVNLVNNAIDAASAQDEKWVMVELKTVGGKAQMTVTDSGKGIPEDLREKIFTPLFSTKREAGTGLGLAIVQKIVKAHGGEIFLENEASNTRFVVNLPTAA